MHALVKDQLKKKHTHFGSFSGRGSISRRRVYTASTQINSLLGGVCGVVVSTLATHASGPGSIPVAGGKKERLISLLLNIRGCAPRGSHIT